MRYTSVTRLTYVTGEAPVGERTHFVAGGVTHVTGGVTHVTGGVTHVTGGGTYVQQRQRDREGDVVHWHNHRLARV
jgi:hypothetical protein